MIDIEQVKKIAKEELKQEQFQRLVETEKIRLKNRKPWYIQLYEIFFLEILPKGTVNGYRELITCQKEKIQDLVLDNTRLRTYIEQQQYSKQYLEEQKVWKEFEELSNEQKKY